MSVKRFWRGIPLLLAVCLLCGCQEAPEDMADISPRATIVPVAVEGNASPLLEEGAAFFAASLQELSGGRMAARVIASQDASLPEAGALAFVSNDRMVESDSSFAVLETPFLFESEQLFFNYINRSSFLSWAQDLMGQARIISGLSLGQRRMFSYSSQRQTGAGGAVGLLRAYYSPEALLTLGYDVRVMDSPAEIASDRTLWAGEAPLQSLPALLDDPSENAVSPSAHSYCCGWIVADETFWQSLTQEEQSLVTEAAIRTAGYLLESSRAADEAAASQLQAAGITAMEEDWSTFAAAARQLDSSGVSPGALLLRDIFSFLP